MSKGPSLQHSVVNEIEMAESVDESSKDRLRKEKLDGHNNNSNQSKFALSQEQKDPSVKQKNPSSVTLSKLSIQENWKPAVRDQLNNMVKLNLHRYFDMNVNTEPDNQGNPAFLNINIKFKQPSSQSQSNSPP